MICTPISTIDSMQIGTVDFVSPDEIKIVLLDETPKDVSLNAGFPRPFPRVNGYVLIPDEGGSLVAQIEWITAEKSQQTSRKGIHDFNVVDLPYPDRRLSANPVGVLHQLFDESRQEMRFVFTRGIESFPTVGDPVLIPSQAQLRSIIESEGNRRVDIGISPMAANAIVSVDPDKLFGRHLAVLGNTGSGKSCSVAGLIRWSIESARDSSASATLPNSRFIILDPNGEYSKAFVDLKNVHIYAAEANESRGVEQLVVPLWLWNSSEWVSFAQAGGKAQKPTLIQTLRNVRSGNIIGELKPDIDMRNYLRTLLSATIQEKKTGTPWKPFPHSKGFFDMIKKWREAIIPSDLYSDEENSSLTDLTFLFDKLISDRSIKYPSYVFSKSEIDGLISLLQKAHESFGGSFNDIVPIDADTPIPFDSDNFILGLDATAEMMNTSEYVETMIVRIKSLLSDARLKPIICPEKEISLETWLDKFICPSKSTDGSIVIIDLSLLPMEIVHLITSVIARMTLESLQRYRKMNNGNVLPTVLVMEEAHTFIRKFDSDNEENPTAMCTRVFDKIAREGRKYGLGLVLSSQRPSELSQTVLSQCNSFLLHRISNDRDQDLVGRLVSDNLKGILRELPSLSSRNAILLGWATELPVMVRMNYLEEKYRPQSNDPAYWDVWRSNDNSVDWEEIAEAWIKKR